MDVLGLHHLDHDSGACRVSDGEIVCISEERLNRKKHSKDFPLKAIDYCLQDRRLDSVDLIVIDRLAIPDADVRTAVVRELPEAGRCPVQVVDHHDAHAASAFWVSPFDHAAVLIVDGYGADQDVPGESVPLPAIYSIYHATPKGAALVFRATSLPGWSRGIGMAYSDATLRLGFRFGQEGKTMGLSAYAEASRDLPPLFENRKGIVGVRDDHPVLPYVPEFSGPWVWEQGTPPPDAIARATIGGLPACKSMVTVDPDYARMAAYVQAETERALVELAAQARELTGESNLCLAGGCALNGLANARIMASGLFEEMFIQPAASDTGIPLGAALWGYHEFFRRTERFQMGDACLATPYSEAHMRRVVQDSGFAWHDFGSDAESLCRAVATLLAAGEVVAWFQGASEYGPRALGHRSILADARRETSRDILNAKIKRREAWRPFAPSVLEECANVCFVCERDSPYMLSIASVRSGWRDRVPACLHCDGSARIQTVSAHRDRLYYSLLLEFYLRTGVPLIVNTSLNLAGEPIVESPEDAISCMIRSGLEWLALGSFIVTLEQHRPILERLVRAGTVCDAGYRPVMDSAGENGSSADR